MDLLSDTTVGQFPTEKESRNVQLHVTRTGLLSALLYKALKMKTMIAPVMTTNQGPEITSH